MGFKGIDGIPRPHYLTLGLLGCVRTRVGFKGIDDLPSPKHSSSPPAGKRRSRCHGLLDLRSFQSGWARWYHPSAIQAAAMLQQQRR